MGIGGERVLTTPDTPPTWGRLGPDNSSFQPRLLFVVVVLFRAPLPRSGRATSGSAAVRLTREDQLVNEALATPAAMDQQILQLLQPVQMDLQLRIAPARRLAHVAAREAVSRRAPSSAARTPP